MLEKNSPLLSLVWQLRRMRNYDRDFLLGRILTYMESIISKDSQLKAVKDMVRGIFYEKTYHCDFDDLVSQFGEKFCPGIEKDYKYTLFREGEKYSIAENYFPEL